VNDINIQRNGSTPSRSRSDRTSSIARYRQERGGTLRVAKTLRAPRARQREHDQQYGAVTTCALIAYRAFAAFSRVALACAKCLFGGLSTRQNDGGIAPLGISLVRRACSRLQRALRHAPPRRARSGGGRTRTGALCAKADKRACARRCNNSRQALHLFAPLYLSVNHSCHCVVFGAICVRGVVQYLSLIVSSYGGGVGDVKKIAAFVTARWTLWVDMVEAEETAPCYWFYRQHDKQHGDSIAAWWRCAFVITVFAAGRAYQRASSIL